MMAAPTISVQLVHLLGPLKGEIQELSDSEILIGRHPDCQVNFPKELVTLSRVHAKIVREGNRFKLIDQSTNGTFVNGQKVTEAYLKDGDVVMFAEGGPKVSFLTQVDVKAAAPPSSPLPRPEQPRLQPPPVQAAAGPRISPAAKPGPPPASPLQHRPIPPAPPPQPAQPASSLPGPEKIKAPLAIQYGPALKSFQTLPIVIGKGPSCDFTIPHPALSDTHAQVFFAANQYWIKDLTGSGGIRINGRPVTLQAALEPDAQIALSPTGPKFRFLGGGRLIEVEEQMPDSPAPSRPPEAGMQQPAKSEGLGQKAGSLFKKFFS